MDGSSRTTVDRAASNRYNVASGDKERGRTVVQQTVFMGDLGSEADKRTYHPSDKAPTNHDLSVAIEIVRKVRESGREHSPIKELSEALAAAAGAQPNSIKNKLYSAAKYGLVAFVPNPETKLLEVMLSPLGNAALDPQSAREAMITAFLNVPVNRAIVARYHDRPFPPSGELEQFMEKELRMASSQIKTARQIITRAAEQAGLLDEGRTRLTLPPEIASQFEPPRQESPDGLQPNTEDGMALSEHPVLESNARDDEVVSATIAPMPDPPAISPIVPQVPTEQPPQPFIPNPAVIEWWWQKKPRTGDPEAKWLRWHKTLGDILVLEFDEEGPR